MRKLIVILILALGACSVGSKYERPAAETPAAWKNTEAKGGWPDIDWWNNFGSAELTALEEQAKNANYDIKAAIARVTQANASAKIAGAALLPAIDASASGDRQRRGTNNSTRNTLYSNSYVASLNASYELDFWGKNRAALAAAEANIEASRFDRQTIALSVSSDVATTYFAVLGTRDRLQVAEENLANSQQLLQAIKDRFNQGLVSELDVTRQESVVNDQRAAIPPLRLQLEQNNNALAILLGELPESLNLPKNGIAGLKAPEVAPGIPSELLARRPDIANAEAQLVAANANITAARAAFFPSISLTGSAGYQSSALSELFKPEGFLFSIAGSALQPIFEGGRLSGQLELTKARQDELVQNYRKVILSAFGDVENSLAAVRESGLEMRAREESAANAKKSFELSERQLKGGIIDITTVLDTQRILFSAEDALVAAKLSYLQSIVGLYRALGGGWHK